MQLDYASCAPRPFSITAIASLVMGFAVFVLYGWAFLGMIAWLPLGAVVMVWGLLIAALLSIILGIIATVKRRRLWWMGLIGASLGAMTLGQWVYFVVTFSPPIK